MSTNNPQSGSNQADAATTSAERNERKVMQGMVVSCKMQKTIVVQVDRKVRHPQYEKFVSRRTKLYAHDELGTAKLGDLVEVAQTRPLSKLKRWRLVRVVRSSVQV